MNNAVAKTSLAANVILAVFAAWLVFRHRAPEQETGPAPTATVSAPTAQPSADVPDINRAPDPFRWGQIESTNYTVYIANLRSIGCPEQTIREIVTAEIHDIYEGLRHEMQKKPMDDAALAAGLAQLRREEESVVAALLGPNPAAAEIASADGNSGDPRAEQQVAAPLSPTERYRQSVERRALARPITMPIVFQPVDQAVMKLSDDQLKVIQDLQQKFLDQVGTNQDPNDPEYRKRWQAAQISADEWFAALLGRDFRMKYQAQAMSLAQRTPPN